jgi:transcriptional regulator with XRE-family HTH domain
MAAPQSPVGSRRRLGAELRRLRTKVGLTLDEVAEKMTCSTSKISRLETGKGIPKIPDVRELMRIYGVSSDTEQDMLVRLVHDGREQGWWESYTEGVEPERYMMDAPGRYASIEGDARTVLAYDITVVHGLLQTEDYMRSVISPLLPQQPPRAVDQLVALRLRRQEALTRADGPALEFVAVIDEAVLRRPVGGTAVMVAQLGHLLSASQLPSVTIRILPFEVGLLRVHVGAFTLLEIPPESGSDVVYIEGHAGETFLDMPSDVDLYRDVFSDALERSLSSDASAELIARYMAKYAPRQQEEDSTT